MKEVLLCGVAIACLSASAASAQEASALEEVVVTAQRRAENLQDVPIAVTVANTEALARARVDNILQIGALSPSVSFHTGNNPIAGADLLIRGLGTTGPSRTFEGAVGIFIDGVYRTRPGAAMQTFLDLENLQILRGPQGTLFGKNTSAGAVLLNSAAPTIDEVSGAYRVSLGNYDNREARGAINVPIGDRAAFRLAAAYTHRDGFYEDVNSGDSINADTTYAVKGQFFMEQGDFQGRLIVDYSRSTGNCCYGSVNFINGPTQPIIDNLTRANGLRLPSNRRSDREATLNFPTDQKVQDYGATLILERDLGFGNLRSTTAVRRFIVQQRNVDPDFSGADIFALNESFDSQFFSQELTLTGEIESLNANYVLGGYFSDEDLTMTRNLRWRSQGQTYWNAVLAGRGLPPNAAFAQPGTWADELMGGTARSYAAFAHTDFSLSPQWNLIAGVRYTVEEKGGSFRNTFYRPQPNDVFRILGQQPGPAFDESNTDRAVSGTLGLQYHPSEDVMVYATYNRGFKAGGVNIDANAAGGRVNNPAETPGGTPLDPSFDTETVNAYEVGTKIDYLDGRARTNIAAFYNDISGLQVAQFIGLQFVILNAESAELYGVEVENTFEITRGYRLELSGTWLPEAQYGVDPRIGVLSGGRFRYAPRFAGSASLNFDQPLTDDYTLNGRIQYQYMGSQGISNSGNNLRESTSHINLNLGIASEAGRWRIEGFVRNLTNVTRLQTVISTPLQAGDRNAFLEPPRTYGVTFRGTF